MKVTPWHMLGGAALYSGSAYAFYAYFAGHKLPTSKPGTPDDQRSGYGVFDSIAQQYDKAIGSEEWAMGTHYLRKWILNHAYGDVLEISAGTGRNLPHYTLSKIKSLTLADLSLPMLEQAEDKFYDDLRLGERHPDTHISFCISDAHCMTAQGTQSSVHTLPALRHAATAPQRSSKSETLASSCVVGTPALQDRPASNGWGWSRIFQRRSASGGQPADAESEQPLPALSSSHASSSNSSSNNEECGQHVVNSGKSVWKPWAWFSRQEGCKYDPSHSACADCNPGATGQGSHLLRCRSGVTEAGLPLSRFATASFDTVVDAFGLCSHEDPVQVLREVSRVCKPDGKILLLEHGRGHYDWINSRLDGSADAHQQKWGCWWNRDIEALITQAGLRVETMSRWHFGTTYICIARPAVTSPS